MGLSVVLVLMELSHRKLDSIKAWINEQKEGAQCIEMVFMWTFCTFFLLNFYSGCVLKWVLRGHFFGNKTAEVKVRQTKLVKLTSNLNSAVTFCLPTKDVHLKPISIHSLNKRKGRKERKTHALFIFLSTSYINVQTQKHSKSRLLHKYPGTFWLTYSKDR